MKYFFLKKTTKNYFKDVCILKNKKIIYNSTNNIAVKKNSTHNINFETGWQKLSI